MLVYKNTQLIFISFRLLQVKPKSMGNCFSNDSVAPRRYPGGGATTHTGGYGTNNGGVKKDEYSLFPKSHGTFSQIELSLSASILEELDGLSKSNTIVVVYAKGRDGTLDELGRSEVVLDQSNPMWIQKHIITYHFEVMQTLLFHVYNVNIELHDTPTKLLKLDELKCVGEATCILSKIITKTNRSLTLDLINTDESKSSQRVGDITIHADECAGSKSMMEMILRCSDLEYKDPFSRSDPFLLISKTTESGSRIPVCKTDVKKNDINPTWKPIFLNIQQVGSKETPLILECFNFNSNGRHDMVGKIQKSLADLEKLQKNEQGENLILPTVIGHNNKKKQELQSQLFVETFLEYEQHTFLDYISNGCELNFMVAVDFTASNGNPRLPDSLHYLDPSGRQNPYQRVISVIGDVVQFYDTEKRFPAWGFGARAIDGPVSHCFNLNGSTSHCEVDGVQGILTAYASAVPHLSLAGPTLFGPVINSASLIASQSLANYKQKYFVLLIITDGVITDLQETKELLVKAADLPISVLVVGVGGADYKEMEVLDADKEERLESHGKFASRHIVQFVPFRDVQSGDITALQSLLSELQVQFLQYMRNKDIHLQN